MTLRLLDLSFTTDKVGFSKFDLVLQTGRGYFGRGAICRTSHNEDSIIDYWPKPKILVKLLLHNQTLLSIHSELIFFLQKPMVIYKSKSHWRYASSRNPSMYTLKVLLNYYTKHISCNENLNIHLYLSTLGL